MWIQKRGLQLKNHGSDPDESQASLPKVLERLAFRCAFSGPGNSSTKLPTLRPIHRAFAYAFVRCLIQSQFQICSSCRNPDDALWHDLLGTTTKRCFSRRIWSSGFRGSLDYTGPPQRSTFAVYGQVRGGNTTTMVGPSCCESMGSSFEYVWEGVEKLAFLVGLRTPPEIFHRSDVPVVCQAASGLGVTRGT